jgi:hypothetical protein
MKLCGVKLMKNIIIPIPGDAKSKPSSVAEGQEENRCSIVSSTFMWHRAQLYPSSKNLFLLLKIFLVFNMSLRSSQAKNLILGTQLLSQLQTMDFPGWSSLN